jgi:hypothetical protein
MLSGVSLNWSITLEAYLRHGLSKEWTEPSSVRCRLRVEGKKGENMQNDAGYMQV